MNKGIALLVVGIALIIYHPSRQLMSRVVSIVLMTKTYGMPPKLWNHTKSGGCPC
jgi:hypothetical protein